MKFLAASGAVLGPSEKEAMHAAIDKGWLTAGPINAEFERALASYLGVKYVRTCNSGSSANLLAISALVATGKLRPGGHVLTPACAFPTTVNPLLLYRLVPTFVDVELGTYVPSIPTAVAAHTLGNPCLYTPTLMEDCCDALGSTYAGDHVGRNALVGTVSFFPAHHITTGEGGAVWTNDDALLRSIESIRDWGRDCYCAPGANNTCGKRFGHSFDGLPRGYDHKYTFTQLGFNLKMTEVQAACGLAQLAHLPEFVAQRKRNFHILLEALRPLEDDIILPQATLGSDPSWFGFPITIREEGLRAACQTFLLERGIDSRLLFAGNIARQPYMQGRKWKLKGHGHGNGKENIAETLPNTDKIMRDAFWVGVWPGLDEADMQRIGEAIRTFFGDF